MIAVPRSLHVGYWYPSQGKYYHHTELVNLAGDHVMTSCSLSLKPNPDTLMSDLDETNLKICCPRCLNKVRMDKNFWAQ